MSSKETVQEVLRQLPDEISLEEIIDHLTLYAALRRAEADADAGRVVPHEEVKARIKTWVTK